MKWEGGLCGLFGSVFASILTLSYRLSNFRFDTTTIIIVTAIVIDVFGAYRIEMLFISISNTNYLTTKNPEKYTRIAALEKKSKTILPRIDLGR